MNKRILAGVWVVVLIGIGGWLLTHRGLRPATVSGTIEADEAHVGSRFGGRVKELLAKEGSWVRENAELVQLDADDIRARYDVIYNLLAELEAGPREQEVEAAKRDWDALKEEYAFAQREAKRKQDLLKEKAVSDSEADDAATRERTLKARMEAAEQRYNVLASGTRPERIAQVRAQLAEMDAQLDDMLVKSPVDAMLESIHVKPGDIVPPNGTVATVLFWSNRWVRVYVPETWLGHIKEGQQVTISVDAFRDRSFTGTVVQINNKAEFTPRNVQTAEERVKQVYGVKVQLQDEEGFLYPGMSADVTFPGVPRGR